MAISNMAQVLKWLGFLSTLVSCKHHHVFVFLRGEIKIRLGLETIMSFPYFPDIGRYRNMFTFNINVSTAKQCTHYYTHASQFVQLSHLTRLASCWSVLCACRASRSFSSSMARLISSTSLWLYTVERIQYKLYYQNTWGEKDFVRMIEFIYLFIWVFNVTFNTLNTSLVSCYSSNTF